MALLWRFDADTLANQALGTSLVGETDSGPVSGVTKSGTAVVSINNVSGTARASGEHIFVSQKLANQTARFEKSLGSTQGTYGFRFYIRWASTPSAVTSFVGGYLSGTEVWHLRRASTTRLTMQTGATLISNAPTTSTANNTWYRVEGTCSANGILTVNVYTGDGTSALLTLTGTSSGMQVDELRFGAVTSTANVHPDMKMDEFYVHDSATEPGPWFAVPTANGAVTTTAPSIYADFGDDISVASWIKTHNDQSYHDGIGDATRRVIDIYTPASTPPVDGWPIMMFVHGGAFYDGDEEDIGAPGGTKYMADTLGAGFAVVSVSYKLTDGNILLDTNVGWTHPAPVQDVLCAAKYVVDNAETLGLDGRAVAISGYSAGGHIVLEAALAAQDANRDTYDMVWRGPNTTQNRYTEYPNLDMTQGRTVPTFIGVASWAGPVMLSDTYEHNPIIPPFINIYYGRYPNSTYSPGAVDYEADLDKYITGDDTSVYASHTPTAPDFPIAFSADTADITVPISGSITALVAALDTVGYDTSAPNGTVASGAALSRNVYTGNGHDWMMIQYNREWYRDWLTALPKPADAGVETTAPGAVAFAMGEVTLSRSSSVTTSAPNLDAVAGTSTAAVQQNREMSLTGLSVPIGIGTPSTSISINFTTTAPSAGIAAALDEQAQPSTVAPSIVGTAGSTTQAIAQSRALTTAGASASHAVPNASLAISNPVAYTVASVLTEYGVGNPTLEIVQNRALSLEDLASTPNTSIELGAASIGSEQARTITTSAAATALTATPVTQIVVQDRSSTIEAPTTAAAVGSTTPSVSQSRSVDLSAPQTQLLVGTTSVAVVQSRSVMTVAPEAGILTGTAVPSFTYSKAVTTTAPTTEAALSAPGTGTEASRTLTTTAPSVAITHGSSTGGATQNRSVTTTAPSSSVATGSATSSVQQVRQAQTVAPSVDLAVTEVITSITQSRTVTLVAPSTGAETATNVSTGVDASRLVITSAPAVVSGAGVTEVSVSLDITVSAPSVDSLTGEVTVTVGSTTDYVTTFFDGTDEVEAQLLYTDGVTESPVNLDVLS